MYKEGTEGLHIRNNKKQHESIQMHIIKVKTNLIK